MRRNVKTTVNSVLKGLQIAKTDIDRQASKFESRISDAPRQEKEFMTISRQQEIKATLYIMLLQKREENAITLAATANNGRIIEDPQADERPVAPKKLLFMLAALILGFAIPVCSVYLHDLLKYRSRTGMTWRNLPLCRFWQKYPLPRRKERELSWYERIRTISWKRLSEAYVPTCFHAG